MISTTGAGAPSIPTYETDRRALSVKFAVAAALAAIAHHWLWAAPAGLGLAATLAAVGVAAITLNASGAQAAVVASALLALAVAPLLEAATPLSVPVALALACLSGLAASGRLNNIPAAALARLGRGAVDAVARLPIDLVRARRAGRRRPAARGFALSRAAGYLAPLVLALTFVELLSAANPVIESWRREALGSSTIVEGPFRIAFVLALLCPIWAWLRPSRRAAFGANPLAGAGEKLVSAFFPDRIVAPSLILFNAVFALQTTLDIWLLWGGGALPAGMTYAEYAHRGAYPLLAAALLAAAFVLLAFRPGSAAEASGPARALVYLWLAQLGALVCASILRLDLYVGAYGLTIFRVAAFVWMGLVAAGLALIAIRIAAGRSGGWLIGVNAIILGATLYALSFVDVTAHVASYNVRVAGEEAGPPVDLWYMARLGPHAIPAYDRLIDKNVGAADPSGAPLSNWRKRAERRHRAAMSDWRNWTWRDLRLLSYLDARAAAPHLQDMSAAPKPANSSPMVPSGGTKTEAAR